MHIAPIWDIFEASWIDFRPNKRFAIYSYRTQQASDDAVLDRETGLVWERSPSTDKQENWDSAIVYSVAKVVVGRRAWRLPTIEELSSLADPTRANPTLSQNHPFVGIQMTDFYWSSTLGMSSLPTFAWGYNFGIGDISNVLKTSKQYAWLVRGGYGHDYPF